MITIEPCCYTKQLNHFFDVLSHSVNTELSYLTNSDWVLGQLLEWMIWLTPKGEVSLILPKMEDSTVDALYRLMQRETHSVGEHPHSLVGRLNIILPKEECNQPRLLRLCNLYKDRVNLAYDKTDTSICLFSDGTTTYSLIGSFNQTIDHCSRIVRVSKSIEMYNDCMAVIGSKMRVHRFNV